MRYFFLAARAHHAYFMALDFGMEFESRSGKWTREGILHVTGAAGYKLYVHSDSIRILEPRVGDVLYTKLGRSVSLEEIVDEDRRAQAGHIISRGGRIIQRDGRPFHWPESEGA